MNSFLETKCNGGVARMCHMYACYIHSVEICIAPGNLYCSMQRAPYLQIFGFEHDAEGSSSGELSSDEECSGFNVDRATTAYYEFHSNVACTSDVGVRRFFDEEIVGDCVSDYGIYDDNELGIAHIRHIILPKTTKKERFQAASKCCMDILLAMATIGIL